MFELIMFLIETKDLKYKTKVTFNSYYNRNGKLVYYVLFCSFGLIDKNGLHIDLAPVFYSLIPFLDK